MPFWKKEELFLYPQKLKESMDEEAQRDQLCKLMEMYQIYHNFTLTKQYVPRASIMICEHGSKPVLLDTQEDHGVYMGNIPVMTCLDCRRTNIHNFGSCKCPEWKYEKRLPMTPPVHPNGEHAVRAPWNRYPHICIPLVSNDGWQQEEDKALIKDSGHISPMLVEDAFLICQYGGIIWIPEVAEEQEEIEKECIILDDWLYLYFEPTVLSAGRAVEKPSGAANLDWAMGEELKDDKLERDEDWFKTKSPACQEITKSGGVFQATLNSNNLYTDNKGRYWVALGPNVMNPDHPKEQVKHNIFASEMHYGTKIDIVVKDKEGTTYYIPAVVGDAKEHSYPDGLYQTGVPFNKTRAEGSKLDHNTVEFIGYEIPDKIYDDGKSKSSINITNNYKLIEIIVYDGVYNYE